MNKTLEEVVKENEALKNQINAYEKMIDELSAPIIPSILPETILVPLTGTITERRIFHIQDEITKRVAVDRANTVLIDFTGISKFEVEDGLGYQYLGERLNALVSTLSLMGVNTIFVGFTPQFAQKLILTNAPAFRETKSFATFRRGLQYLLTKKNLKLVELEDENQLTTNQKR
ncbi:rsbT co-antagonist protein RsbR [Gracilibacillus halotolerans]|uniref:RsbT co-antagonist protein RsbR n=1 Tax=Gracilibacillus halotolerans TaxID=74386 RepID=A0A841RIG6_9BACI|nr:STAS domain-containing protein [Gracilibacillus halotolerans]MBB6512461.1 rsbT co-antagonist protein RsbR [Gracilibacillus halotolerans]